MIAIEFYTMPCSAPSCRMFITRHILLLISYSYNAIDNICIQKARWNGVMIA